MKFPARIAAAALAAGALSFSACAPRAASEAPAAPAAEQPVKVSVGPVGRKAFAESVEYYGTTEAVQGARIVVAAGGRVEAVAAEVGDDVRRGQSLASVDLERAEAAYGAAVLSARIAEDAYRRLKGFLASGSASKVDVDNAELGWSNAKLAVIQAERNLAGARCESPLDGQVLSRSIKLHDETGPGSPAFSVGDISSIRVKIGVSEADRAELSPGAPATVALASLPGTVLEGSLESLALEPAAGSRAYEGSVLVPNPGRRILPGATAKVVLRKKATEAALVVPAEALLTSAEGRYAMVAAKDADGWIARKVYVAVGASDARTAVVVSGLSEGDAVILDGNHVVKDGGRIAFEDRVALASEAE